MLKKIKKVIAFALALTMLMGMGTMVSGLSYDIVMDMFRNLPRNGNFFSNKYWSDNIQKAQARS